MRVLITGGAGFIGSQTTLQLLREGHDVFVFDNFSNSSPVVLERVQKLSNQSLHKLEGDIRDPGALDCAFRDFKPDTVIHFAGLKAVAESAVRALDYYDQNLCGTLQLIKTMEKFGCFKIVFSSSATVYGVPQYLPYDESHPLNPESPYGRTKRFIEELIRDWAVSQSRVSAVLLRYFNPVGADVTGEIGEDPLDIPNNLVPYIAQVAVGRREVLEVFGNDYETRDGTGERDYIHICDLAHAHLLAMQYLERQTGCESINVGTGKSATVLEMISHFEKASGRHIPYTFAGRREGDVPRMLSSVEKAKTLLGWRARYDVAQMCESVWNWQIKYPLGYTQD